MSQRVLLRRVAALIVPLVGTACGDDLPDPPDQVGMSSSGTTGTTGTSTTDDPSTSGTTVVAPASSDEAGATTTTGTTTGHTTVGIPDECTMTAECEGGELCVAPFDQSAGPEGKGAYECVSECVALMDEDRWCADVAACCDPLAECTDRGYCVYPDGSTGGTEGSGTSGGSTGTTG